MSDKKLTSQEIEDKLGIKLEYHSSRYYKEDLDQTFTKSYLEEKSAQDLIEIEIEALKNGDVDKAELSHSLLKNGTEYGLIHYTDEQKEQLGQVQKETMKKVIEDSGSLDENASASQIEEMVKQGKMVLSTVEKVDFRDDEYTQLEEILIEKNEELQVRFLDKYTQELESIDLENFNKEDIIEVFEKYDKICELCDEKNAEEGKKKLRETLQKKVEEKINQLDEKIKGLKEHIEIPENENKINELQTQIEDLEDILVDFKARQDFKENWKAKQGWEGLEYYNEERYIKGTDKDSYEERYRQDYRKVYNHREMRIQEQGKDISDIMRDIASYRDNGSGVDDYNFTSRNSEVAKKTQYLEGKLIILRQHEGIEGNSERIAQIEQELESMQDAWVIAQRGYNNIDENIQDANEQIKSIQNRIAHYQEELKTIAKGTRAYDQQLKVIERENKDIKNYESQIDRLTQTKDEILSGENPTFMGEHHRDRYNREQDAIRQAKQELKERAEQEARAKKEQEEQAKAESKIESEVEQSIETEMIDETMQSPIKETQENAKTIQPSSKKPEIQIEEISSDVELPIKQTTINTRSRTDEVVIPQQTSRIAKTYEQPQPEKIRPQEESIRDEIEEQFKDNKQQLQEQGNPTVDLWMNRFSNWYNFIDRLAQNAKAKFVKMKSDIMKVISSRIKERNQKQEMDKKQEGNER